jgi:hypothetical protein
VKGGMKGMGMVKGRGMLKGLKGGGMDKYWGEW